MKPDAPVMRARRSRSVSTARSGNDARLRYRDDELASALPVLLLLGHDLFGEIPGQDEQIVGHALEHLVWRNDGNTHPWREASVLQRVAIREKLEQVRADAVVVE